MIQPHRTLALAGKRSYSFRGLLGQGPRDRGDSQGPRDMRSLLEPLHTPHCATTMRNYSRGVKSEAKPTGLPTPSPAMHGGWLSVLNSKGGEENLFPRGSKLTLAATLNCGPGLYHQSRLGAPTKHADTGPKMK